MTGDACPAGCGRTSEAGTAIEVAGLAAQYETTYEVAPRQASDLVVVPPAAGVNRD